VARGHPLARRERLRLGDCLPYPILLGDETLGGRLLLDAASEAASVALRPAATSNAIAVLQAIAAQSNAVCFQIEGGPPPKGIVALPLADRGLRGRLVLGVARNRSLPVAAAVFLEKLKAELTG
jgi:DNA-binding transcriptional LysR family regulator